MKESILYKRITILKACAPNKKAIKYKQQRVTELKGKSDESITQVWDFNILLSLTDRSTR